MNKTKGVVITIAALLLLGTGSFVFANPNVEEEELQNTGGTPSPTIKKSDGTNNDSSQNNTQTIIDDTDIQDPIQEENENNNGLINNSQNNNTPKRKTPQNSNSSQTINSGTSISNGSNSNNPPSGSTNGGQSSDNQTGNDFENNKPSSGGETIDPSPTPNPDPEPENPPAGEDTKIKEVEDALKKLEEDFKNNTPDKADIDNIQNIIDQIEDPAKKEELQKELDEIKKDIDIKDKLDELKELIENANTEEDIEKIKDFIENNNLTDLIDQTDNSELKEDLSNIIDSVETIIDFNNKISKLDSLIENAKNKDDIDKIKEFIDNNNLKALVDTIDNQSLNDQLKNSLNKSENLIDIKNKLDEIKNIIDNATSRTDVENAINVRDQSDLENKINNLEISELKSELIKDMDNINVILNDNVGPVISGITNGDIVKSVSISFDESDVKAYINNKEVTLDYINNLIRDDTYTITFVDRAFNTTTITFTIDNTPPIIMGINKNYNAKALEDGVVIKINDQNNDIIYIQNGENVTRIEGNEITLDKTYADGIYTIWSLDKAGNSSEKITFQIDATVPTISNIENGKTYNAAEIANGINIQGTDNNKLTFYYELNGVTTTVEDNKLLVDQTFTDGTYKVWCTDEAENTSEIITFSIDTIAPQFSELGIQNNTNLSSSQANIGDEIQVFITFDEKLITLPIITINNIPTSSLLTNEENGIYTYVAKYIVDENSPTGEVQIKVSGYQDKVLNTGVDLTNDHINSSFSKIDIIKNNTGDNDNKDDDKEDEKPENGFVFENLKSFNDGKIIITEPNYAGMIVQDKGNGTLIDVTPDHPYTTTEREYTVTKNGSYKFTLYDNEGKEILSAIMTFDNKKPEITGKGFTDDKEETLIENHTYEKVEITATDNALSLIKYIKDGKEIKLKEYGKFSTNNRSFSYTFEEAGDYQVVVIDRAGNTTTKEFTIVKKQSLLSRLFSII